VYAGKLGQVTDFTIVGGAAEHCVDQYMVLIRYCSLGGDTAMPGGLHARLCHAFLVLHLLLEGWCTLWSPVNDGVSEVCGVPSARWLFIERWEGGEGGRHAIVGLLMYVRATNSRCCGCCMPTGVTDDVITDRLTLPASPQQADVAFMTQLYRVTVRVLCRPVWLSVCHTLVLLY